jgi:hypothetical protein
MRSNTLIAIWYKPRKIIHYLQRSALSHFRLMMALAFIYFVLIGTFLLSLEKFTISPLFSLNGVKLILLIFLQIGARSFAFIYIASLIIWAAAKGFQGQGTLPQTRGAVIWTLICTIPIGFFLLLLNFAYTHPDFPWPFTVVSLIAMPINLIYGFIVLLQTVSETHRFGLMRAFFSTVLGLAILSAILFAGRSFFF